MIACNRKEGERMGDGDQDEFVLRPFAGDPSFLLMRLDMGENKLDTSNSVVLTGTAREGTDGPAIGHVDIGVSQSAYLFRVSLPGVRKDNCDLNCEIERDGKVHLQGVITGGELAKKDPQTEYQSYVSQLNPPGPFNISFKLPGPVDPRLFAPTFRSDGILEGVVMKYRAPGVPPCGNQFDPI